MRTSGNSKELGLYIHIPFCRKKCGYCSFYVVPDKPTHQESYLRALKLEWECIKPLLHDRKLVSIYFGGGTPSLMGAQAIESILDWISPPSEDIEITLEANPEDELSQYLSTRVNRISLGVQSLDDQLLKLLTRSHTRARVFTVVEELYSGGMKNLSIDLMYELPHQTPMTWMQTLNGVSQLPINHVSLYNLTFEPHTSFFKKRHQLQMAVPSDEVNLALYRTAIKAFSANGLEQYEISAFAKPGYVSRHNTGYWMGRPFIGLGPSAFSYWEGKRYRNAAHLGKYVRALDEGRSPVDFEEALDFNARHRELFVIRLRLNEGVRLEEFHLDSETLEQLDAFIGNGLIVKVDGRVFLSQAGREVYDAVATQLI